MTTRSKQLQIEILQKKLALEEYNYIHAVENGESCYLVNSINNKITRLKIVLECVIKISQWERVCAVLEVSEMEGELDLQF